MSTTADGWHASSSRVAAIPSSSGIRRSIRTTWGCSRQASSTPSRPVTHDHDFVVVQHRAQLGAQARLVVDQQDAWAAGPHMLSLNGNSSHLSVRWGGTLLHRYIGHPAPQSSVRRRLSQEA